MSNPVIGFIVSASWASHGAQSNQGRLFARASQS